MRDAKSSPLWSAFCLFVLAGISVGCGNLANRADQVVSDCDNTRDEIIDLTEQDRASRGYAVVKIYDPVEVSRTDAELKCQGRAKWSDGDETSIVYRSYLDSEGERLVEYEVPE